MKSIWSAKDGERLKAFRASLCGEECAKALDLAPLNETLRALGGISLPAELMDVVIGKALFSHDGEGASVWGAGYKTALEAGPFEQGRLLPYCRVLPTADGEIDWGMVDTSDDEFGGVVCDWFVEGAEIGASDVAFKLETLRQHQLGAFVKVGRSLSRRSATPFELLFAQLLRPAFMVKAEEAIIDGSGEGRALGVLQTSGIQTVNRAVADQVSYDDLCDMEDAIPVWMRSRGVWVVTAEAMTYLKKLKDLSNFPIFAPGSFRTILDHPVVVTEHGSLGTAGDVIFGDFSWYVFTVEQEMALMSSEHRYAEAGTIAHRAMALAGGRAVMPRAFAQLGDPEE
jgi:HK97 family phage major capsid protein